jgi:23S rRNA pseudouridine1911/1915/1917 synthase
MKIIFEDNHLIAVNKPSGLLVQVDQKTDDSLEIQTKAYLRKQYSKPGEAFLGIVHRIDRPVSGLVLMAKTSKALERMNQAFKDRAIQKEYYAVVRNKPAAYEATLHHWLYRDERNNITKAYTKEAKQCVRAELSYEVISDLEGYYLLRVTPITGRTHQIRAQLAAIQCPIVGDNKYGYPRANKDRSICLHSRSLRFNHPVTKEATNLIADLPEDPFWQKFI